VIISRKIRLKPTKQQEELFMKSAGAARFVYNMMLSAENEAYQNGEKFIHEITFRKRLTELKKGELSWLKEVGSNVAKQAYKDCQKAFDKFFTHKSGYPKFKSRNKTPLSFYVNIDLGIKDWAIFSDGTVYPNINKSKEVRRLKKKLRRAQRASSRKIQNNI